MKATRKACNEKNIIIKQSQDQEYGKWWIETKGAVSGDVVRVNPRDKFINI